MNSRQIQMIQPEISIVRKEVVQIMYLMSTRNGLEIEQKSDTLISSLENHPDPEIQGYLFYIKGISFFFFNKYQEAKKYFERVFETMPNDVHLCGIASMGLGFTYRSTGHLDKAVTNLSSATEMIDSKGVFQVFLAYCYQSLGEIHTSINEYDKAIKYYGNAYKSRENHDYQSAFFRYHIGLGGCYLKMKDYEKSKIHLKKAHSVNDRSLPEISRVENDLGVLYLELKEYDNAENFLSSSLTIREANKLEDAASTSMSALAEVYIKQNRIAEALDLLNRCLLLVDKYQTKWKKINVLKLMAIVHTKMKNHDLAVEYYEQYIELYDEIKGEQERNIFKFKNEQIEKQKKIITEKHNQLSETLEEIKRLKVNRKAMIFSWITIIILVVISELFLDPLIDNYAYNNLLSLSVKVLIALLFKPIDGLYENILWKKSLKKVT